MCIKIVTDSTCDLPDEIIKKYDITVIPIYVNLGDHSFRDGVDLVREDFYSTLKKNKLFPTTSSPSIDTFINAFKGLAARGAESVLSIHIASSIGGVYNVAAMAGNTIKDILVSPFDAGQISLGTGVIVETAAMMAQAGKTLNEILTKIHDVANRTYTFAILDNLNYLKQSGRVSQFKSLLGSILRIKPVLRFHKGQPSIEIVRTNKAAVQRLLGSVKSLGPLESLNLLHIDAPEKAEALRSAALVYFPEISDVRTIDVSPVIGSHLGPGAVGFAAVAAPLSK